MLPCKFYHHNWGSMRKNKSSPLTLAWEAAVSMKPLPSGSQHMAARDHSSPSSSYLTPYSVLLARSFGRCRGDEKCLALMGIWKPDYNVFYSSVASLYYVDSLNIELSLLYYFVGGAYMFKTFVILPPFCWCIPWFWNRPEQGLCLLQFKLQYLFHLQLKRCL